MDSSMILFNIKVPDSIIVANQSPISIIEKNDPWSNPVVIAGIIVSIHQRTLLKTKDLNTDATY